MKKILSLLSVFLMTALLTSTVSAGGGVGLRRVVFSIGSLDATGTLTGLGGYTEGVKAEITASGLAVVLCTNQGGNESPGQNPNIVTTGEQLITPQDITKKGTAPMNVTAEPGPITWEDGGCPNENWTASVDFVFWTAATITIKDPSTDPETVLLQQNFTCVTTRDPDAVSCTPVP